VNVWFRDHWGNTSQELASDTILMDTTAPANGMVAATQGDASLTLNWSGFDDGTGSGIDRYQVAYQAGSVAPSSCNVGTKPPVTTDTTQDISIPANNATYSFRVCAIDGAGNMSSGATVTSKRQMVSDTTPPTGTVSIKDGAAATTSALVTLKLTLDPVAVGDGTIQMCISNNASCSAWSAFAATKSWTLAAGTGTKTVNVWYRDQWGNTSPEPNSDTIILDTAAPVNGKLTVEQSATGTLSLNWSGFDDGAGSGIVAYWTVSQKGTVAPSSCNTLTRETLAADTTTLDYTGLVNGTISSFRVCAVDAVGKISSGATVSGKPVPHTDPPTGTVTINGGDAGARSTAVKLTLALDPVDATDLPVQMCVSNSTTCSAWTSFAGTKNWTLPAGIGTKTVNVWFRDKWGNRSLEPHVGTIILDTTAPTNGTVTADPGDASLTLTWDGFADGSGSGIAGYRVVFQTGSLAPASCSVGTPIPVEDGATTLEHTGLVNGTTSSYRVCAVDAAGNVSSGATATGMPPL